jgi:hypothetical protein
LETERLYIQATAFAGDLPRLPINLFELDCSFTLISGGLTDENFDGLDELNWLLLDGNAYNSSVPSVFGSLKNLEFLYISDAFISGDLSYMEGMPKIVEHWIDVNPGLTGPVFPFIGGLNTLESFSVTQNGISGELPIELGNLDNMAQMWFYGNILTGQIPAELGDLRQMSILQLESNAFTGSMPAEVCANIGFLRPLLILGSDCNDVNFEVSDERANILSDFLSSHHSLAWLLFPLPVPSNQNPKCSCCTCCNIVACNPGLFQ